MNAIVKQESNALALPESELMKVLQSSLYPGAAPDSIKLVISYCKASGLDPMQKPVHIVPMWDGKARAMRDVIMPGVNLYRTQAARSGQFAGMTEPEFGPEMSKTLSGIEVTFPEWCRVTVKRLLGNGVIAEFTAIEYWMENYAVKGGQEKSIAPNAMWMKRPRGQIAKCAAAQALRIAFPEIASQNTAEEMEGKQILDIHAAEEVGSDLANTWITKANAVTDEATLTQVWQEGVTAIKAANDMATYKAFKQAVTDKGNALKEAKPAPADDVIDAEFVEAMDRAEAQQ